MSLSSTCGKRWIQLGAAIMVAVAGIVSFQASANAAPNGSLAQAVAAAAKPPQSALSPAAGRVLGGLTSQHSPIILEISKNAKRIDTVAANLQLTCTFGTQTDQIWLPDGWSHTPLDTHGSVSLHVTIPPDTSGGTNGTTLTGGTDTFSGKLNRKAGTFSGTWRLQLSFSVASTTTGAPPTTESCDSGTVTFKARL